MTQEEYYKDALSTLKNGEKYLLDMIGEYPVGVRVICSFGEEVYQVAEWLCKRKEIQLRTIALDFWAVLEHQMKYKQSIAHESIIQNELKRCADEIASVDISMQTIRELLRNTEWEKEVTVHTGY